VTLFAASIGGAVITGIGIAGKRRCAAGAILASKIFPIFNEDFGRHSFAPSRGRLHTPNQGIRHCERDDGSSDDGSG